MPALSPVLCIFVTVLFRLLSYSAICWLRKAISRRSCSFSSAISAMRLSCLHTWNGIYVSAAAG